ncbi:nuclease-related domain-containing protein [Clostridium fallax]|uniref:Nuclease-related domain-containing protein n=1 Tax=Clostridium fallax TaxID=1533 RepID=A0A1M4WBB9_9CLOT|nr:nuclease-related domain-containing protein [Clostridium fallax]SHE78558.1 Nuclease-related domain-containing protein [Clostridium fallax]SQB05911.1 NERD domain-containing protein [Clostridium fallax]
MNIMMYKDFVLYSIIFSFMVVICIILSMARYRIKRYSVKSNINIFKIIFSKTIKNNFKIYEVLERIKGHKRILANVKLPLNEKDILTLDFIVLHKKGIFIIKYKNINKKVIGNEDYKYWGAIDKRNLKSQIDNPIIEARRELISLDRALPGYNKYIKIFIVFGRKSNIKNIIVKNNSHIKLTKINSLVKDIEILEVDKSIVLTKEEIDYIYYKFKY